MSIANTNSTAQMSKTASNHEEKPSRSVKQKANAQSIKKQDQVSFLENLKGSESSVAFITANFENCSFNRQDTQSGASFTGASAQTRFASQMPEDASAALLSNTIIQKLLRDPTLRNMKFSVQNKYGSVNVEAAISSGQMRCALSSTSEKLKRRMHNAREQIISRLGGHLRMPVELDIEE